MKVRKKLLIGLTIVAALLALNIARIKRNRQITPKKPADDMWLPSA